MIIGNEAGGRFDVLNSAGACHLESEKFLFPVGFYESGDE